MLNYFQALEEMHRGNVVKYVGTVNGPVWSQNGAKFCMCRGCVFLFDDGIKWLKVGYMVYDPDYRYELTGESVDPRAWMPEKKAERNGMKSKLGYSRIGLGNV
jgi:hypothetical protein